jgi:MoxR-like ATPase
VFVDRQVAEYAVALVSATRTPGEWGLAPVSPYVDYGASPRGSLQLVHGARALALLRGRSYALPADVTELAKDVLRHRIVLSYQALAESVVADQVVDAVLAAVPVPHIDLGDQRAAG